MNRHILTGITTIIIWQGLISKALTQQTVCSLPSLPKVAQSMNNVTKNNVIVIGKVSARPYVVVIPGDSEHILNRVRRYVSEAFVAQNRLGTYVYVGGYANRFQAECWTHLLKSQGFDARVVYFR
jgi:hypothetical protein